MNHPGFDGTSPAASTRQRETQVNTIPFRTRGRIRSALSLIEVLMSIFVVAVGLLGVAALLPVAGHQTRKGALYDQTAFVGREKLRDLSVRGYDQPQSMLSFNGNGFAKYPLEPDRAFVIDPRFIAQRNNEGDMMGLFQGATLPYSVSPNQPLTTPFMDRITLLQDPSNPTSGAMGIDQADEIFMSGDDIAFSDPKNNDLVPQQVFTWDRGGNGVWGNAGDDDMNGTPDDISEAGWPGTDDIPLKRQSNGRFSWILTAVPALGSRGPDTFWGTQGDDDGDGNPSNVEEAGWPGSDDLVSEEYEVSVVVFNGRLLDMTTGERVADVPYNAFWTGGVGGGEVALVKRPVGLTRDLEVTTGDWLMLAKNSATGPQFKWYRIIAADKDLAPGSEVTSLGMPAGTEMRFVTLEGPDWFPDPTNSELTVAILFSNVIAVYQTTVRLGADPLYSN